ncbi:Hsp33 family molecular chaperone HslO [Shimazuella alba]|jgi:molecular chaperone Hsp33|uniref:33 kDa chaperonin n=1 Tax=Shimazuella alba TaxID=2690964 RepID=A0A6I4VU65_9BACL|nr:Hsp33 family molecular chaperone HslO [Shimazuella alba]MXQ54543.1 Hsp33 family molecular chaperone HslO [Shimazuella alba]
MDYTTRAISADGYVRGFAALTTNLVQELQKRHFTFPVASAALGRTVTMASLLSLTIKDKKERITIQVEGDGPLGRIVAETDGESNIRGYVDNPDVLIPLKENGKLDVSGAVGQGSLYITRDLGLGNPYQGASPIVSGELAEDFTYYFTSSEQTPSSVGLGVLVNRDKILVAGGYMVQLLPNAPESVIDMLEARISKITSITDLLAKDITPEQLLQQIMGDDTRFLEKKETRFGCTCSRDKVKNMLVSLGEKELTAIVDEVGEAEVVCHFCNEKYQFNKEELLEIIGSLD